MMRAFAIFSITGWMILAAACASKSVELTSEPAGVEVQTISGETLGSTPLILKDEALDEVTSHDGFLAVRFIGPGFVPQTLMAEVRGNQSYKMQLAKVDASFFKKYVLRDFNEEHNDMIRRMLNIQGLIRSKKLDVAEKELDAFQDKYPTIAIAQIMLADIALIRGDRPLARRYLYVAQSLDPNDPVISRMLGSTSDIRNQVTIPGSAPAVEGDGFIRAPASTLNEPSTFTPPASAGAARAARKVKEVKESALEDKPADFNGTAKTTVEPETPPPGKGGP